MNSKLNDRFVEYTLRSYISRMIILDRNLKINVEEKSKVRVIKVTYLLKIRTRAYSLSERIDNDVRCISQWPTRPRSYREYK